MFSQEQIRETIQMTFSELTWFIRDTDLDAQVSQQYEEGMIIRHEDYVDASYRVRSGLKQSHRFIILSNHMVDYTQQQPQECDWGWCVGVKGSRFKVLKKKKMNGKTIIFLLHLPLDETWKVFETFSPDFEKDLIEDSLNRVKEHLQLPVIEDINTPEWLEKVSAPVGMDADLDWYSLEAINKQQLN